MPPFPLDLVDLLGHWESYIVYLAIGFSFGFVLELAGFGNSKLLAAQFYFKDMTVLKVMFGAIIVAMTLIFLTSSMGLLDYNIVYVNPTYLWPGIVGGLIMGVGFIVGGFCPGTSLVSAATLKLDGVMFLLGVFFGIFLFGETVGFYEDFWYSSYMGRYTLQELFNVEVGVVVLGVVLAALGAFWASEQLEKIFGDAEKPTGQRRWFNAISPRWRYAAAGALALVALLVMVARQPTAEDRWTTDRFSLGSLAGIGGGSEDGLSEFGQEKNAQLLNRDVQVHPGEVLSLVYDDSVKVVLLDVRSERDFNLFHIEDSWWVPLDRLDDVLDDLREEPANTVFFTISNDETAATEAWRTLVGESIPNVYILGGGINKWIEVFGDEEFFAEHAPISAPDDTLKYGFVSALGARYATAQPHIDHFPDLEFEEKVELVIPRGPGGGGCG